MKSRMLLAIFLCLCCLCASASAAPPPVLVSAEFLTPYFPDHILLRGHDAGDVLYLLMENPSGETVFIGGTRSAAGEWMFVESTPLPEDTILGNENFVNALRVPIDGFDYCVVLAPFHDGTWGVSMLDWGEISLGRTWISCGHPLDGVIGDHPWSDITAIDWTTLPASYQHACLQVDARSWGVVVQTGEGHQPLFAAPDGDADRIAACYPGAPVRLLELAGAWTRVAMGSLEGWMQTEHLALNVAIAREEPLWYEMAFAEENTPLYDSPDLNAAAAIIEGTPNVYELAYLSDGWVYVWLPRSDQYGYVPRDALWGGDG